MTCERVHRLTALLNIHTFRDVLNVRICATALAAAAAFSQGGRVGSDGGEGL